MENIMKDSVLTDKEKSINFIKDVVCAYYNLDVDIYKSKSRKSNIINAKHIAIYICKTQLSLTLVDLGEAFGFDHSTILYINKKIAGYIEFDSSLKRQIQEIENILKFKVADTLKLEKDYYYISLNDFVSIKQDDGKAIILKGFTEKEIQAINFIDTRSGLNFFDKTNEPKSHTNQKFYILEKINK
jgi:hypothetical protein